MLEAEVLRPITTLGLILILLGVILVLLPLILKHIPEVEKLPSILVYVYKRGNFVLVTSPLLILISLIYLIYFLIRALMRSP